MEHAYSYEAAVAASERVSWRIEDVIGREKRLDFSRPFLPENLARVEPLEFLDRDEKRVLNQIRAHGYLYMFGTVEEFILPFVLDHARPRASAADVEARALLRFAEEEAKHIQLFRVFRSEFRRGFGHECEVIGPPQTIAQKVLSHDVLAVALTILHIEWMTQRHFVESARDDGAIDPQFKSLLKHHWLEEAQHAKLDMLMIESLSQTFAPEDIERALREYLEIGRFLDSGLGQQVALDLAAFERATGRSLSSEERARFTTVQRRAQRWTFIGSGMTHRNVLSTFEFLRPGARSEMEEAARDFCWPREAA